MLYEAALRSTVATSSVGPLYTSPPHLASRYVDVVATLLHCGADAGALDDNKKIPIDAATNLHIAKLLRAHRSDYSPGLYAQRATAVS